MGKIEVVQRFTVVESKEARMTTVSGRDFQMKFQSVEFYGKKESYRLVQNGLHPKCGIVVV